MPVRRGNATTSYYYQLHVYNSRTWFLSDVPTLFWMRKQFGGQGIKKKALSPACPAFTLPVDVMTFVYVGYPLSR
jgi:hypothetical protein